MHEKIKDKITSKKDWEKYIKTNQFVFKKKKRFIIFQDSRYPIPSIFEAIKILSTSKNMRDNIWRSLLNVLRMLRRLWIPNMEISHHQSISKLFQNIMHKK